MYSNYDSVCMQDHPHALPSMCLPLSVCYIEVLGMVLGMRLCLHVCKVPLLKKVQEKWLGSGGVGRRDGKGAQ